MAWLARDPERRVDPEAILPGCRSVVVVTLQYLRSEPVPLRPGLPKVSRYAWGDDYHEILGEKLERLRELVVRARPDARVRIACDTSPIAEKSFAAAAGVGWLGKNACLIHPRQGSWFFLGELFLDFELPPDAPIRDMCGSCRRCLDACPTDAFPEPYVLDARRCISYWTIEHRGVMPEPWPSAIGEWLVGCDICQDVCPWNRKAPLSNEERFRPRPQLAERTAAAWLAAEEGDIRTDLRGTAVTRIKPADLKRNASHVESNLRAAHNAANQGREGELPLERPDRGGYFSDAGGKDS